ncbi:glycosyltransferase family 2 protein [Catenuloplanes indicus]|uniref:Hyaluronan synthase n=1 Tax=Catenuloplanes indicus TaxID=137267 RepID=A0AAE4AVJ7_9ACTN|nr:glycosyltransferase family 2 protein [Catenuloplanes indicus]MDQ0364980.1 N-acetylglucosaminyltransferase [Catenuloplanes indicus]
MSNVAGALDVALPLVFGTYLVAVLGYLTLQVAFAERARRHTPARGSERLYPAVDVIVPCFNEKPATLAACLESLAAQDYPGRLAVHVVDDGSPNRAALLPVFERFRLDRGFHVFLLPRNRGKRYAQVHVINETDGDVIVAVDSDTMIAPDGIRHIVGALDEPNVGAAMGEMTAANRDENWLTRLIDVRYWYACNQERAAQSLFGAVLCCSGPFSAYRRSVLEKVLDDYVNQRFLGRRSTYGEDRYLTNLILQVGSRTVYAARARAVTTAPDRIRPFLRQQLRWNRCTYRDTLGIAGQLPRLGAYLVLDAAMQVCAPLLLGSSALLVVLHAALAGTSGLPWYLAGYAGAAVAYCGYGVWRTRDLRFTRFALYGVLHAALLIPNRLWALLTITDDRWGRRGAAA